MIAKARADQLVFEQGLAESKEQARRLIMAGKVTLAPDEEHPERQPEVVSKPGHPYRITTKFQLAGVERFVSRGAYKLLTAIEQYHIDVTDFVCLDAGASTGGFTDCLLQYGAKRVYAVDVGHAQLHEKLRADPRVVSREGMNLRTAPDDLITEPVDLIVADLSFISLTMVLPHCLRWLRTGGYAVCLIKPQFEVGAGQTVKGVVKDEALRQEAVDRVIAYMEREGLRLIGVTPAAIKGPKGNQEYLAYWEKI
ncbi:MAG: TlyA family RNA methyltransferase [Mailhella sp.]|nr:TlyA family RNA methyltransferase [Mailhella sp.]